MVQRRVSIRARRVGRDTRSRSAGFVLIFFMLFFVAFFGLFAVVVDLGIARSTQLSMQSSADVAAIEGLAARDIDPNDLAASDLFRRQSAATFAALVFDEDLDRSTGADQYLLGAGPTLETGVGGVNDPAGGLIVAGGPWIPSLELNDASNLVSGDLVAGDYLPTDPSNAGNGDWHVEANDYTRSDFSTDTRGESFLARLRRTRENQPLDRVPGVSSAGPTLPYLFGLGSALTTPDADVFDPRRDGITVRAASIASARPVTIAGLARPGLPGLAPVGIDPVTSDVRWLSFDESTWSDVAIGEPLTVAVDEMGTVTGSVAGLALVGDTAIGGCCLFGPTAIPSTAPVEITGLMYATLHAPDAGGTVLCTPAGDPSARRVRGFVAIRVDSVAVEPGPVLRINGVKLGRTVAPRNASAQRSLISDATYSGALSPEDGGLLAPVIAR